MLIGVPLALGSWWGLLLVIPITLVLVWRLLEEEKFLTKNLPGYPEYQDKVRYRLLPLVFSINSLLNFTSCRLNLRIVRLSTLCFDCA